MLNIQAYITYIVYDLGALGVTWNIKVMDSGQVDELFKIDPWTLTIYLRL